jgi:hypothetical protein
VVDLDGKSINTKLFVGRSVAGVQPKIAIERISGSVFFDETVEDAVPKQGETGTLVHTDEKGDTVALVPMTVDSVWTQGLQSHPFPGEDGEPAGPRMTINARTMMGKAVELVIGRARGIVDITPDHRKTEGKKAKRKRYAVSSEFNWVPMSEFKEFMDQPRLMRDADDLEKKASIPQLRVIYTGLGYGLQAPWVKTAQALFDKEAAPPGMLPRAAGANAAAAGAAGSPLPTPDAPSVSGGAAGMPKGASLDLSCLSEGEARHILCELGANVATADGVLKYAKVHGSLRVRGLEAPIEKLARHPFLAVPGKGKALRAALMGLGLGGAGLAAGGAAGAGLASAELASQHDDGGLSAERYEAERARKADYRRGRELESQGASALDSLEAFGEGARAFGDNVLDAGSDLTGKDLHNEFRSARRQGTRALEDVRRQGTRALEDVGIDAADRGRFALDRLGESEAGGRALDALSRFGIVHEGSVNPALEMIALLRKQAKAAFSKLAYVARVQYGRGADDTSEADRLAKFAEAGDTIEAALDLNFLNPQNLSYFIGMQPKLKDILDGLGRLLVAVRLGLPDIDEETVRSAVKQIDSILSGLRALSFAETDG